MENSFKKIKDKTKEILSKTKKGKGDTYLVNFPLRLWEKLPKLGSRIQIVNFKSNEELEGKIGKIVNFQIMNIDKPDYHFVYVVELETTYQLVEVVYHQFQLL